jgi:GMP synthase PP-ATPase subunit
VHGSLTCVHFGHVAAESINEARGINRAVYDITLKPAGTIKWE